MPIEEYEREIKTLREQARQEGYRNGQQQYLKVLKQIVLAESLENCSIMWNGMAPEEKQIINKLIETFIAKKPLISTTSTPPVPGTTPIKPT